MLMIQERLGKIHTMLERQVVWLDTILLTVLCIFIVAGIRLVPFHGDEATYIWMSQDYDYIVNYRNPRAVLFNPEQDLDGKSIVRLSIGSILSFSIGFMRDLINSNIPVNGYWHWGLSYEENVAQGYMPDSQHLMMARACSAIMGALGVVFFFLAVRLLLHSRLAAWIATLALATQGDLLANFRRAMQEGPKFLFLMLTILLGSYILQDLKQLQPRKHRYVMFGMTGGLMLAAKQDTVSLLIAIYVALSLIPFWQRQTFKEIFENLLYLAAATSLAIGSFFLLMPVFWGWWETSLVLTGFSMILLNILQWNIDRNAKLMTSAGCALVIGMTILSPSLWRKFSMPFSAMVDVRKMMIDSQLKYYTENHLSYLDSPGLKVSFLLSSTLTSKVMYMDTSGFDVEPIREQIVVYEFSLLSGRTDAPILDGFIVILFIVGTRGLIKHFRAESLFTFSLLVFTVAFLLLFVPLPWRRYFLIMQVPYALIAGAGAEQIWTWGKQWYGRLLQWAS